MSKSAFESRLVSLAYLGGAPAVAAALALAWLGDLDTKVSVTVALVVVGVWLVVPLVLRERVLSRIRAMSSVLEAFREGDYSIRTRDHGDTGALGTAARELNALGDTLRDHRAGAAEATALLDKVMASIEVVVLAIDEHGEVVLANAAAERWLGKPAKGRTAGELALHTLLEGPSRRLLTEADVATMSNHRGSMELTRSAFRQRGKRHDLIVLADVGHALQQKEREAWQKLVRVLGHEINSSLTPMTSLAESLQTIVDDKPDGWSDDVRAGLDVIGRRAGGLARFMTAYAQLAKLPPPTPTSLELTGLIERCAALEPRLTVAVAAGNRASINADADQLDQVLLNLLRNATDAALEVAPQNPHVSIGWHIDAQEAVIHIDDNGPGVSNTDNLFVPFFTTKADGNGIGLVLSRQIAEAHGGTLELESRAEGGARATLRVPLA